MTEEEALALFWDENKRSYIFPSQAVMDRFMKRIEKSWKPAEGFEPPTPSSFG